METISAIKSRRSVRKYIDKPIPKEILKEIVDCGRLAPSGNNSQPWEFLVITGKADLEFLARVTTYGKFLGSAGACVITFCDQSNRHHLEDGAAATENMILVSTDYGISTCWIAGYNRMYEDEIKQHFNVPSILKMISIISLGYSNSIPSMPHKRSIEEVLHWEKF